MEKLNFEIVERPVLFTGIDEQVKTLNSHKVILRDDTNQVLSVMKSSYHPMTNGHFMESTERMKEISGFDISGYSTFDDGRIVLSHLKNNLENFEIGGHKIEDYLVLGSSFDGRYPFFVGTSTVFLRCKNQFSKLNKVQKVRHTKSSPQKIDDLYRTLEVYFNNRKKMYENFEKMREVKLDPIAKQLAMDYFLSVSKEDRLADEVSTRKTNQMEVLRNSVFTEINDLGDNLFAIFNGATRYTTHELNTKEKSFGNLFGTPAEINKRAYEYALQLVD